MINSRLMSLSCITLTSFSANSARMISLPVPFQVAKGSHGVLLAVLVGIHHHQANPLLGAVARQVGSLGASLAREAVAFRALLMIESFMALSGRPCRRMAGQPLGDQVEIPILLRYLLRRHPGAFLLILPGPLFLPLEPGSAEEIITGRVRQQTADPILAPEIGQVAGLVLVLLEQPLVTVADRAVAIEETGSLHFRALAEQVAWSLLRRPRAARLTAR